MADFDDIESSLLRKDFFHAAQSNSFNGIDLGSKINISVRVQNDISRSEKKGERQPNIIGRDDRATTEQVLDPRTRLILFKLLGKGFLSKIDGKYVILLFVRLILLMY